MAEPGAASSGQARSEELMAMRRLTLWTILGLLIAAGLILGGQRLAAESGEVVVLTSRDASGAPLQTRLWVVDLDGSPYLRGREGAGWYARLIAEPRVRVERDGVVADYLALPSADRRPEINELMRRKYGWRDVYIGLLVGGRDDAIPVQLTAR